MGRAIVGLILIVVGLSALLGINIWQFFWPAILIMIGVLILVGRSGRHDHTDWKKWEKEEKVDGMLNYSAVFQSIDKKVVSENFKGGRVESVFGAVNLDLRGAKIKAKNPVGLKIDTVFGGIKIMVPKNWEVRNQVQGFAGGVHDTTTHSGPSQGKLTIFGSAVFGGVEISN